MSDDPEVALFKELFGERSPIPHKGIMFIRCMRCGGQMRPKPVRRGSTADGGISDGLCWRCFRAMASPVALPVVLFVPSALLLLASAPGMVGA
jgi:hypothetical protein